MSQPIRLPSITVRLLTVCLTLVASTVAHGQQDPEPTKQQNHRPFFWRIDGEVPSYLFGTIHLPDERVTQLHPEVEKALDEADAVFTELAMDKAFSAEMALAMQLPAGRTLQDVLPDDLQIRVEQHLGQSTTSPALQRMRPWVIAMQVTLAGHMKGGDPLDIQIYKDAKSAGKEVGGLEEVAEQLSIFSGLGIEGEVAYLKLTLDMLDDYQKRGLDLCEEMIKAYCDGDSIRMLRFFDEMNGDKELWGRMSKMLLTDRNLRMAERIDRKLHEHPDQRFLFAVGAGHLLGETNIVDLLRARGFTVTRMPQTQANLDEEIDQLQREVEQRQARILQLQQQKIRLKKAG